MKCAISLSPTKTGFGPLLFAGELDMGVRRAAELGYDGIELSLRDSSLVDRSELQSQLKEHDLCISAIATGQGYYNDGLSLYSADRGACRRAIDRMKGHVDLAAETGAMVIIGGIRGYLNENQEREQQVANGIDALDEICAYAYRRDVSLLLEPINRYETNIINSLAEGARLIDDLGWDNLKLLADTFHMNIEEMSLAKSLREVGTYIGYVHFADSNRLAPGWGHIDFEAVHEALVDSGFSGFIGIEVLPLPSDLAAAEQGVEFVGRLRQ